ncbi:MAG: hypothetical protein ABJA16_04775 [Nakamurella sp.]
MSTTSRTLRTAVLGTALVIASSVAGAGPAAATAANCPVVYWGSLAKTSALNPILATVDNVRTGRHTCYDRIVFDVGGRAPLGYTVGYAEPSFRLDGSDAPVDLIGGADLQITINAPAHDLKYVPTFDPADPTHAVDVTGYRTLRQVYWGGTYEGYTTVGLGVRARLPYRVFQLDGPGGHSRFVIDVAHQWTSF